MSQRSKKRSALATRPMKMPMAVPITMARKKLTATRASVTPTWNSRWPFAIS